MAPLRALASLLALLRTATLCAACELLDPDERLTFTERSISGNWVAQIKLRAWQEGATISLTFNTNTEITSSEYAVVQRGSPRTTELRLLGRAPFNMLGMEGKGGCWQPSIDKCSAQVTCQMPDSPSPPPAPPVRSPPPAGGTAASMRTPMVRTTPCGRPLRLTSSSSPSPRFENTRRRGRTMPLPPPAAAAAPPAPPAAPPSSVPAAGRAADGGGAQP